MIRAEFDRRVIEWRNNGYQPDVTRGMKFLNGSELSRDAALSVWEREKEQIYMVAAELSNRMVNISYTHRSQIDVFQPLQVNILAESLYSKRHSWTPYENYFSRMSARMADTFQKDFREMTTLAGMFPSSSPGRLHDQVMTVQSLSLAVGDQANQPSFSFLNQIEAGTNTGLGVMIGLLELAVVLGRNAGLTEDDVLEVFGNSKPAAMTLAGLHLDRLREVLRIVRDDHDKEASSGYTSFATDKFMITKAVRPRLDFNEFTKKQLKEPGQYDSEKIGCPALTAFMGINPINKLWRWQQELAPQFFEKVRLGTL